MSLKVAKPARGVFQPFKTCNLCFLASKRFHDQKLYSPSTKRCSDNGCSEYVCHSHSLTTMRGIVNSFFNYSEITAVQTYIIILATFCRGKAGGALPAVSPMDVFPATSLMVLPPVDMMLRSLMACCSEVGSLQSSSAEVEKDFTLGHPAQAFPVDWHGPLTLLWQPAVS